MKKGSVLVMKLIKELIRITKDQQDNIIEYQKKNNLTTKAEAYRHLLSSLSKEGVKE
jgi:CRISPR/Cas system-associated endoribonuclease Cas2